MYFVGLFFELINSIIPWLAFNELIEFPTRKIIKQFKKIQFQGK